MTLCKYCKNKNMTLQEYEKLAPDIKNTAMLIKNKLTYNGGMYFDTKDILTNTNNEYQIFIIKELKNLGIEFIENNTLYRVTE